MRLINLDRSPGRLACFRARNPQFAATPRFPAIDGQTVDRPHLIHGNLLSADLTYTDGALGCALSHLLQWREAAETGTALTVLEDDAILCANFQPESERILSLLPPAWDFILWGYNFDGLLTYDLGPALCTMSFDQAGLCRNAASFSARPVHTTPFRLMRAHGTVGYSVSPGGARRLLDFCMPLRPMEIHYPGLPWKLHNIGIDNMMAEAWPTMQAYVTVPPLIITENELMLSTVQPAG